MELCQRWEQILCALRPVFKREKTFDWFVLLMWGVLLSTAPPAVTSYVNGLGLGERYYAQVLHWFHATAFSVEVLCAHWSNWLQAHPHCLRLRGQRVYIGDGIKVNKEGRRMPGVKQLHQESANVGKPEWIRGHYFSALGLLLGRGAALFVVPLRLQLHDGIEADELAQSPSLVDKMATLCVTLMESGSTAILDAYYASGKVLQAFRAQGLHLITRVRLSTVAPAPSSPLPGQRQPGRPRKWGASVRLRELFAPLEDCPQAAVWLYGRYVTVAYQCFELYWDSSDAPVLFVLTQLPGGKPFILLASDVTLSGPEVIEAYGWRFKIEVTFRTLVHLLGGFGYRFWLKAMTATPTWPQTLILAHLDEPLQHQVKRKVEAFERFLNLNAIVLGILQVLALEMPHDVWTHSPRWFRTRPKHGLPTAQFVQLALQHQWQHHLMESRQALLLAKLLAAKRLSPQTPTLTSLPL
ncbi:hypothetical protein XM38_028570 [Halomicronema hongdechloris C2206]|uniref:Uncharacterized protein n=1 Tax=Halomicronema hongdechloris C2206 TaxID=1641165 RepID=A0A1Z3HNL8_9CYAN|nr:transposase [Halomicronema hongdechloris]ASC71903.1 hypothetical protein XM38_028570 [Halomicronema hongdechloris C2206]